MCIGDFWMFYDDVLQSTGVSKIPQTHGKCPDRKKEGSRYTNNNKISPPKVSWSWHPIPFKPFASNSWQEVIHRADPWGDEHHGAWFFQAKGSGIWFNLGKTIHFTDHGSGWRYFKAGSGKTGNEHMCSNAAKQGYKSVQFMAHSDGGIYDNCRNDKDSPYLNIEIVGTAAYGEKTCCATSNTWSELYVGWQGSGGKCNCNTGENDLNCHGGHFSLSLGNFSDLIVV